MQRCCHPQLATATGDRRESAKNNDLAETFETPRLAMLSFSIFYRRTNAIFEATCAPWEKWRKPIESNKTPKKDCRGEVEGKKITKEIQNGGCRWKRETGRADKSCCVSRQLYRETESFSYFIGRELGWINNPMEANREKGSFSFYSSDCSMHLTSLQNATTYDHVLIANSRWYSTAKNQRKRSHEIFIEWYDGMQINDKYKVCIFYEGWVRCTICNRARKEE